MKKLDRSKPFGEMRGYEDGRVFQQDGSYFDGEGLEWSHHTAHASGGDLVIDDQIVELESRLELLRSKAKALPPKPRVVEELVTSGATGISGAAGKGKASIPVFSEQVTKQLA